MSEPTWNPMSQQYVEPKPLTLAEFLLARIADDEAVTRRRIQENADGRAAWVGPDPLEGCTPEQRAAIEAEIAEDEANGPYFAEVVTAERYLIECEAKRDFVEGLGGVDLFAARNPTLPTLAREWLQMFALPYAEHPDYREEWKP